MKKVIVSLISVLCLVFLVSCGSSSKKNERPATTADNALMYTFSVDKEEFRFRLLDGWIKYPNKDENILFLVGNKDLKAFMTSGFEPKEVSLDEYKESFVKKLEESGATVTSVSEKKTVNELECYSVNFTMKDAKERVLTYQTNLIETKEYFFNLAAWTSQEKPDEKTTKELTTMLETFEQIK